MPVQLDSDTLGDTETQLLRKLVALLNGAATGSTPINVSTAGQYSYESSNIDSKTASGTSGEILAANPNRKSAVIVNYGTTNGAFLAVGKTAESGKGIYLAPNGGSYEINAMNLSHAAINAITATSTTTLSIHEGY